MKQQIRYDIDRIRVDMALRGWMQTDLARAAGVVPQTISNFMAGKPQTARTADKIARALGYTVRRYLISKSQTERVA